MPNGIVLVRCKEAKDKEGVLNAGHFDNKPLIVRAWTAEVELTKENIKDGKCLPAIAGLVGTYQKSDQATMEKTRLGYARVMVELTVGNKFPSKVRFRDETGSIVSLPVEYEWKPSFCAKCKGIGHETATCRKELKPRKKPMHTVQVWRPVKASGLICNPEKSIKFSSLAKNSQQTASGQSVSVALVTHEKSYKEATDGSVTPKVGIGQTGVGLFGLLETKISSNKINNVSTTMLDGWSVTTNASYHKGGRVWLLWKADMYDVHVLKYDSQFVHALVTERCSLSHFYITMVYAFNDGSERRDLWMKLDLVHSATAGPWVVAGDFNTVINPLERLGGNTKPCDMDEFIDCIANCGLTDIHTTGAFYTWTNKQETLKRVYSRLDRFLVNQDWAQQFPNMTAHFYPSGYFDHCPCVVSDNQLDAIRKANFKYFNMWSKTPPFLTTVQEEWQKSYSGYPMYCVTRKLKALKGKLKELNKECYSDVENSAILAEKEEEITALKSFKELNDVRQSYLRQKAKTQWLEDGDANTAYSHGAIKKRCSMNKVIQIEDHNGHNCTTS
ncbi:uncharacterized protein LOC141640018 [Silene latifolia]|uniref:uncharacterized protein LOC141640018 n=1 Tax=Silene latifolia TaxID=37657 RepID=UPI003D76F190